MQGYYPISISNMKVELVRTDHKPLVTTQSTTECDKYSQLTRCSSLATKVPRTCPDSVLQYCKPINITDGRKIAKFVSFRFSRGIPASSLRTFDISFQIIRLLCFYHTEGTLFEAYSGDVFSLPHWLLALVSATLSCCTFPLPDFGIFTCQWAKLQTLSLITPAMRDTSSYSSIKAFGEGAV